MSSEDELERLLREGRRALPEPDAEVTRRARRRAHAAVRRRRQRVRVVALLGSVLALALGAGLGLGTLVGPTVTAAEGEVGIGFLPEPGWSALQAPAHSPADQPAVTMAANVPFASEDVVNGLAEPSALPYATLLTLPPRGIVLVASFVAADQPWASYQMSYPARDLPLRVRDATPYIEAGTAIRPDQPLGQYQLRAEVKGWSIDVYVYFGTPRPSARLVRMAQRQLDGLVIRPAPSTGRTRAAGSERASTPAAPVTIDRTVQCATSPSGGIHEIEARANAGIGQGGSWRQLPYAASSSGNVGSTLDPLGDALAWITAGRPSRETTVDRGFRTAQVSRWGTLALSRTRCRRVKANVPLTSAGLVGGAASPFGEKLDCPAPRRVLVHVRALATRKAELRARGSFVNTYVPMKSARLAVRTEGGKPIMYAEVSRSGTARLFTAKGCAFD